ncbi:ArfGAP with coiled-coil, ankyrin repeat and PH domains 3 [Homo sapiens]|uniref:ArfGAP with coiled-coil, ankyrin repeat and PH domains 3 n=1 Tax=Homo sapiens TaxID=9606 RepID=F8W850_HUMAN|nr:ArfGAP with coiled-coil, ankyrin repeat and PH domains 3 [Homo sapiens]KAI4078029.1 ArfGAP with coiled-coil, ankyrin repeat and PH domains 3 [Homo sapiens]
MTVEFEECVKDSPRFRAARGEQAAGAAFKAWGRPLTRWRRTWWRLRPNWTSW